MNKRCRYVCKIEDSGGRPLFVVTVIERGAEQMVFREYSCRGMPSFLEITLKTSAYLEMWANAQRDGRPAEQMWRPVFHATKFG